MNQLLQVPEEVPWAHFEMALKQEFETLDLETILSIKMVLDGNKDDKIGQSCLYVCEFCVRA